MKQILLFVIWLLMLPLFSNAQSLQLGPVVVWLGMPTAEVVKLLSEADFRIVNTHTTPLNYDPVDGVELTAIRKNKFSMNDAEQNVFSIAFASGKLSYAERSWVDDQSAVTVLASVTKAIGAITGSNGSQSCTVSHVPVSTPALSGEKVFIECGKRSVVIESSKWKDGGKWRPLTDVQERIGTLP